MPDYQFTVGQRLDDVAARFADRPALVPVDGPVWTYAALAARARGLAALLVARGVERGRPVALFGGKEPDLYAAMHAALRLGAPAVPLDTASPPERLARILDTARPAVIVTTRPPSAELAAAATACGAQLFDLSAIGPLADPGPLPQSRAVTGTDVAYIMFTSGSTGFPKGVAISHAAVLNLGAWARDTFNLTPDDILAGANAGYFDNSVFDHYAALLNGAALAPFDRDLVRDPHRLARAVEAAGCTFWFSVPSLLIYLMRMRALTPSSWPTVRQISFGGEGYPKADAARLFLLFSGRTRLWNVYGPTEATCICSAYPVGEDDFADTSRLLPLGHLAPNFTGLVLDDQGRPCPPGTVGELYLGGPQLALGYWRDAKRTEAAFVADPTSPEVPRRLYRTGDLVMVDPADGLYHFVGRADNQIKHMGYRIELEEIEAAINALAYVRQAAVTYLPPEGMAVSGHLVAAVLADGEITEERLRQDLAAALPAYMMPDRVQLRDVLPTNANGKVDRRALRQEFSAKAQHE